MQPPRLVLLLFFLLLLPGTWAHPEGSCKLHLFQTSVFHNTSFVDILAWATLEDIVFATLQKYTWNILYLQPWVYPALPAVEWENLQNLFRIYMHNFNLSMSGDARLYQTPCEYQVLSTSSPKAGSCEKELRATTNSFPKLGLAGGQGMGLILHQQDPQTHPDLYPFVFQGMAGCDLYPNGSYTKFFHLAFNAHDFLSFDVDNSRWERKQESELAAQVERQFNTFTGFSVTLQHLLNVTCVDHMKKFIKYGRAALERQ
ncbi:PREDICTED: antigen-presenting glycoprotein CD1d-like, partial [Fulmarus glacialis]|uniref:antigen-presenting glycoprotein CD1d-like n=1 Tax=Fulmarus glacialis TaxID=30455 RepID=UPI00051AB5AE